ncbi:hypothetical protein J4711_13725 [Staphylococcus epidermidis]|nr:hypothetical protein [Staphylococcus epidermidis]
MPASLKDFNFYAEINEWQAVSAIKKISEEYQLGGGIHNALRASQNAGERAGLSSICAPCIFGVGQQHQPFGAWISGACEWWQASPVHAPIRSRTQRQLHDPALAICVAVALRARAGGTGGLRMVAANSRKRR